MCGRDRMSPGGGKEEAVPVPAPRLAVGFLLGTVLKALAGPTTAGDRCTPEFIVEGGDEKTFDWGRIMGG